MPSVKKLISLDQNIANELEMVAKALNTTQKEVIENALDFYFDYTDTIIADKISQNIKSNKEKIYDAKDVFEKLGIDV